jgi:hypothetical protein
MRPDRALLALTADRTGEILAANKQRSSRIAKGTHLDGH